MKSIVRNFLAHSARRVLAREKPDIIAVTGSVGKTSAKEAIATALAGTFVLRKSPKNYNSDLGMPLAILGLSSAYRSPVGWLRVLACAWWRSVRKQKNYPDVLVLEMGADHRGDIAYLVDVARPRIGVITAVAESHTEFLGSIEEIVREKSELIRRLPKDGVALLNRDDERVWAMREYTKAKVMSFGFDEEADIRALEESLHYSQIEGKTGTHCKILFEGNAVPLFLSGVLGRQHVYAALAAIAVGRAMGVNMLTVIESLAQYTGAPGRMHALSGIKHTLVIDDTYNASPRAAIMALETLRDIPVGDGAKKIAVLGDMVELGSLSESSHRDVGAAMLRCQVDLCIGVGPLMEYTLDAARSAGVADEAMFHFASPEDAGRFVQERMHQGDVVLVKGSESMRMEKVVKEIMAEPERAEELLVRQTREWA